MRIKGFMVRCLCFSSEDVARDEVLDEAYDWLCRQRLDYSANNDIWDLRRRWA